MVVIPSIIVVTALVLLFGSLLARKGPGTLSYRLGRMFAGSGMLRLLAPLKPIGRVMASIISALFRGFMAQSAPVQLCLVMLALAVILLLSSDPLPSTPTPAAPKTVDSSDAKWACRVVIEKHLHDPDSAQWGNYNDWRAVPLAKNKWSVLMQYRAKNGFGALRATTTLCDIEYSPERDVWTVVDTVSM